MVRRTGDQRPRAGIVATDLVQSTSELRVGRQVHATEPGQDACVLAAHLVDVVGWWAEQPQTQPTRLGQLLLRRCRRQADRVKAQLLTQLERFAAVLDHTREERPPFRLQRVDADLRSIVCGQR